MPHAKFVSAESARLKERSHVARTLPRVTKGVMTKDKAMEALLLVDRVFVRDAAFLRESQTDAAL